MTAADRVIRWTTAVAVVGVAAVAALASYKHAYALVSAHGGSGWTARLAPLTVDGVIYASSTVMLDSARRGLRVPRLAQWLLCLGITATLAANVAHGLARAAVAAWPAVALVGSYELLMVTVRSTQTSVSPTACLGAPDGGPLDAQAAGAFAAEVAAGRLPLARGNPVSDRLRCDKRGEIRTEADLGPGPCMIGTAELPGYFVS